MRKLGTDKKSAPPNSQASEYQRISPAQVQELKELVDAIANAGIKQHSETWECLQNKFKVNSYLQLDTTQYREARQYLIAQLPNGYPGEVDKEIPKPAAVPERTSYTVPSKAAFEAATRAAAQVQRAVFETVMDGGDDWKHQRLLLTLINDGSAVVPADVQFIESDSFVTTWPRLTDSIRQNKYPQSAEEMLDMANACLQRLHVVSD